MQPSPQNWQQIIWREWRYNHDLEYTKQLFQLVADEPTGWGTRFSLISLSAISGAALGILIILPITFKWTILQQLALAGMIVGAVRGHLQSRDLLWRKWIRRLESNTPTGSFIRMIAGILLLALMGGMIFGPVFWLMMAGLFWAIGGLITWLNTSLEETVAYNPNERRWWFWWRNRPSLNEVQMALQQACTASFVAQKTWADPLRRLAEAQHHPPPPDDLIKNLLSNNWIERFIARHTLVTLGQEIVFPLQVIATKDNTPLRHTARWLLQNIEASPVTSNVQPVGK